MVAGLAHESRNALQRAQSGLDLLSLGLDVESETLDQVARIRRALCIVAADDEAELRDYYERVLSHFGHKVLATPTNGRELAQVCRGTHPDLVIIDLEMPDETSEIWSVCNSNATPVIVVTNQDHDDVRWAITGHQAKVLVKPFSMTELLSAIGEATGNRVPASARTSDITLLDRATLVDRQASRIE